MSPSASAAVPPAWLISSTTLASPCQPPGGWVPTTSCRRLSTPDGLTSATTTDTPEAASVLAIARPMPSGLPQPVTRATLAVIGRPPAPAAPAPPRSAFR